MKRDIKKQEQKGMRIMRDHTHADLTVPEIMKFKEEFEATLMKKSLSEAIFNLACNAFYMGVAVGSRNCRKTLQKGGVNQ